VTSAERHLFGTRNNQKIINMKFSSPLIPGTLLSRYKRFLADIKLDSGEIITAHCPNSGSMKSCKEPGSRVYVSFHDKPSRKLKYTWELIEANSTWVGINTGHPNKLVVEAIKKNHILELQGYSGIKTEVKLGAHSRIDIMLEKQDESCYVEVKNVTLMENRQARFPDAVTERGQKHLKELMKVVKQGDRGVIFFVVQREDTESFSPADDIDPVYGELLRSAVKSGGVEALAYQAKVTPKEIELSIPLPMVL
jgi:sugar fermentation stimulation protein A